MCWDLSRLPPPRARSSIARRCRRTSSAFSIFGPLVGKEARLKRLFRKLGRARNMDVHRQAAQRGNRRTSKIVFNIMISQDDLAFRFGNFSELFRMGFRTFARSGLHTFTLVATSTNLGRLDGSDGE
jgi:hypothetical protein